MKKQYYLSAFALLCAVGGCNYTFGQRGKKTVKQLQEATPAQFITLLFGLPDHGGRLAYGDMMKQFIAVSIETLPEGKDRTHFMEEFMEKFNEDYMDYLKKLPYVINIEGLSNLCQTAKSKLEKDVIGLGKDVKELGDEKDKLQSNINDLKRVEADLEKMKNKLETEKEDLTKDKKNLEKNVNKLNSNVEDSNQKIKALSGDITGLKEKIAQTQKFIDTVSELTVSDFNLFDIYQNDASTCDELTDALNTYQKKMHAMLEMSKEFGIEKSELSKVINPMMEAQVKGKIRQMTKEGKCIEKTPPPSSFEQNKADRS